MSEETKLSSCKLTVSRRVESSENGMEVKCGKLFGSAGADKGCRGLGWGNEFNWSKVNGGLEHNGFIASGTLTGDLT